MPIYDYVCGVCRQTTEVIHGIEAPGPRFCPACGAEGTLRKALVAPAVHFKGSGWAKKDRSTSTRARAGSDADAAPETSPSSAANGAGATGDKSEGSDAATGPTAPDVKAPAPKPSTPVEGSKRPSGKGAAGGPRSGEG